MQRHGKTCLYCGEIYNENHECNGQKLEAIIARKKRELLNNLNIFYQRQFNKCAKLIEKEIHVDIWCMDSEENDFFNATVKPLADEIDDIRDHLNGETKKIL